MTTMPLLEAPAYTEDERSSLVDFLVVLKKEYIRDFFGQVGLPRSGTKEVLKARLEDALSDGSVSYEQVVDVLDTIVPWGKQHVYLFSGPPGKINDWRDPAKLQRRLKRHRLDRYYNARLPLILPDALTLSSIEQSNGRLRITAVQRRDASLRDATYDEQREIEDGVAVSLRAYVHCLTRTLVAFEWDLDANTAMLQITQLERDTLYEEVASQFLNLVASWLDIEKLFGKVDIRRAIKRLQELEGNGQPEARSHDIQFRSLRGRRLAAFSPGRHHSVRGEADIDYAMDRISKKGVGHQGNFYWLPKVNPGPIPNPLEDEVHVYIVGNKERVNFPTPNSEDVVRYVLQRVRDLS